MRIQTNQKNGRKYLLPFLRFLLFLVLPVFMTASPVMADANVIVDDGAGLLTDEEASRLRSKALKLADEADLNVMLVTTEDAGGKSSQKYADWYYLDNSTGEDGMTLLVDMDNREIYISTSGKMLYYLTDRRIDDCLDRAYRYVSNGDFAGGFEAMLDRTAYYIRTGTGADVIQDGETGEILWSASERKHELTPLKMLLSALCGLAASAASALGVIGKYRMKFGKYKYNFNLHNKLNLRRKQDDFVRKSVTRRRIPRNTGSGGGGFSGGHTTTHSTGGHSFGGGGRKF